MVKMDDELLGDRTDHEGPVDGRRRVGRSGPLRDEIRTDADGEVRRTHLVLIGVRGHERAEVQQVGQVTRVHRRQLRNRLAQLLHQCRPRSFVPARAFIVKITCDECLLSY